MNVLSLFDGMACGRLALERAGVPVDNYFASEIDKHAMFIAKKNWPQIEHVGNVVTLWDWELPWTDLLIGGSPCQGFSFAGKQLAFDDPRSKLFFEYVRIYKALKKVNPDVKFLLENVNMRKEWRQVITDALGVKPMRINSNLVSAQNRDRWYWTNIPVTQLPVDRGIFLKDIVENAEGLAVGGAIRGRYIEGNCGATSQRLELNGTEKSNALTTVAKDAVVARRKFGGINLTKNGIRPYRDDRINSSFSEIGTIGVKEGKSATVLANHAPKFLVGEHTLDPDKLSWRNLTVIECERLQTLPDGYTSGAPEVERRKMIGNGWTVGIIAHIFSYLKEADPWQ